MLSPGPLPALRPLDLGTSVEVSCAASSAPSARAAPQGAAPSGSAAQQGAAPRGAAPVGLAAIPIAASPDAAVLVSAAAAISHAVPQGTASAENAAQYAPPISVVALAAAEKHAARLDAVQLSAAVSEAASAGAVPAAIDIQQRLLCVNMIQQRRLYGSDSSSERRWEDLTGSMNVGLTGRNAEEVEAWCAAAHIYIADQPAMLDPQPQLFIGQMRVRIVPNTQAMAKFKAKQGELLQQAIAAGGTPREQCSALVDSFQEELGTLLLNTIHDRKAAFKRFTHINPQTRSQYEYPDAMMSALSRAHAGTKIDDEEAFRLAVWCLNMMCPAFLHSFDGPQDALGYAALRAYKVVNQPGQWNLTELQKVANKLWCERQELQQTNKVSAEEQVYTKQPAGAHPYDAWSQLAAAHPAPTQQQHDSNEQRDEESADYDGPCDQWTLRAPHHDSGYFQGTEITHWSSAREQQPLPQRPRLPSGGSQQPAYKSMPPRPEHQGAGGHGGHAAGPSRSNDSKGVSPISQATRADSNAASIGASTVNSKLSELQEAISTLALGQQQLLTNIQQQHVSSAGQHVSSAGPSSNLSAGIQPLTQVRQEQFQDQRRLPQAFNVSLPTGSVAPKPGGPEQQGVCATRNVVPFEQEPLQLHRGREEARMYQPTADPVRQRSQSVPPPCMRATATTRAAAKGQHARFDEPGPKGPAVETAAPPIQARQPSFGHVPAAMPDEDAGAIGPSAYLVDSRDSAALGQLAIKAVQLLVQRALGTTSSKPAGSVAAATAVRKPA